MWTKAKGRERITVTSTAPTGFKTGDGSMNIQLTTLNASGAIVASDFISKTGSKLGAVASDTFKDGVVGSENNVTGYGAANYEGLFSVLREYDADGKVDAAKDVLFTMIGEGGVEFYAYQRIGKRGEAPWAVGDEGFIYECTTDVPQEPKDREGYIKYDIPLSISKRRPFKVTA